MSIRELAARGDLAGVKPLLDRAPVPIEKPVSTRGDNENLSDLPRLQGCGVSSNRKHPWRMKWWFAVGMLACSALALIFLLKGEDDTPYDLTTSFADASGAVHQYTFRERDVSAYVYYFVWSQSRRGNLKELENASIRLQLMMRGFPGDVDIDKEQVRGSEDGFMYKGSQQIARPPLPKTITELVLRNISVAVILGIAAMALGITTVLVYLRSKRS